MKSLLCKLADIPADDALTVDFFGRSALVYHADGQPVAAVAICPHLAGPLSFRDGQLICPWHGATFDRSSGACKAWPLAGEAPNRAMMLPTKVESDALYYVWGE